MALRHVTIALPFLLGAAACTGGSTTASPELVVAPLEVNMCFKELGSSHEWQGLQLRNAGDAELVITNIEVRGDESCAFRCYREPIAGEDPTGTYPCPQEEEADPGFVMTLPPYDIHFVRLVYTPSEVDVTDRAMLVITSNSAEHVAEGAELGTVEVPVCGTGIEPGSFDPPDAGPDAGVDGGVECPACANIPPGADWCTDGYPED